MLIPLFIIYIKDFLKFLFVCDITIIISFGYPACDIAMFFFINICLARDLFRELEADF
jgi:hypothetical protein